MKKNKEQSALTMVLLLGVLVTFVVYMYVFSAFNKKTDDLNKSNATLRGRVAELKEYYDLMPEYEQSIKEMGADIEKRLGVYAANVREEDILDLALQPIKKQYLVDYTEIAIDSDNELSKISAETVKAAGMEKYQEAIAIYEKTAEYNNITTYDDLKEIIEIFNSKGDQMNITTISYAKNADTGVLEGLIECQFYYATGTGAAYKAPSFGSYNTGLTNLFRRASDESEVDWTVFGLDEEGNPVEEATEE